MQETEHSKTLKKKHLRNPVKLIVCVILGAAFFCLFFPDSIVDPAKREEALRGKCLENLQAISEICQAFAIAENGNFPSAIRQEKSIGEILKEHGLLSDDSLVCCPSAHIRFPKTSFCFIPGVKKGMSPKMPCVIEKITDHDRLVGVIYVDGSVEQISHECKNYIDLLSFFSGRITPNEKKLLETHLKRLDIP